MGDGQGGCTKCDGVFHLQRRRRLCPYKTGCTDLLSMQETSGHPVMNRLQRCERVTSSRLMSPRRRLCLLNDACPGEQDSQGMCPKCKNHVDRRRRLCQLNDASPNCEGRRKKNGGCTHNCRPF